MSLTRFTFITAILLAASPFSNEAKGEEPPPAAVTVDPLEFRTLLKQEEFLGPEQVRRAYISVGTNQFAFVVPPELRMDASNPRKIVLISPDECSYLTLRIVPPAPNASYRDLVQRQFPKATMLNEFTENAANRSGPAFDVEWANAANVSQSARVVFIVSATVVLEFGLITTSKDFVKNKGLLQILLLTLRTNEGGKLEITRISETT